MEKIKNISNKKIVIISITTMIIVLVLGFTYAYWTRTFTQSGVNRNTYDCFDINFKEKVEGITIENGYPLIDEEGMQSKAYEVEITNTCNIAASYNVILNKLNTSTLDSSHIKIAVDNDIRLLSETEEVTSTVENAIEGRIISSGVLPGKESKTLQVRSWMDEATTIEEGSNKVFANKITIEAVATNNILAEAILKSNPLQKNPQLDKSTIAKKDYRESFSSTVVPEQGLYQDEDDEGKTYYFRGVVENNYVKFANFYWRIVRINGDGSIRMIYDGTIPHENGEESADRHIGTSSYNSKSDSEEHVGYTYPNKLSSKAGDQSELFEGNFGSEFSYYIADEYEFDEHQRLYRLTNPILTSMSDCYANHSLCEGKYIMKQSKTEETIMWKINRVLEDPKMEVSLYEYKGKPVFEAGSKNDSTIKQYLENWYNINLINYDTKIASANYCNDTNYNLFLSSTPMGAKRKNFTYNHLKQDFNFKCQNMQNSYGGNYKIKIGLLTLPEAAYAGSVGSCVKLTNYLQMGYDFYVMSPALYSNNKAYINFISGNACSGLFSEVSQDIYAVRPVINLSADVKLLHGDGTINNPYIIE